MQRNPQNNLPEPLGTIVILANFCLGLWNVYSNVRQEKAQTIYDRRQREIVSRLDAIRTELGGVKS
ncbi:hypothetical protein AALC17_13145 [Oscillospiraceae bacterium 38-13]